jgi:hypothetical protein
VTAADDPGPDGAGAWRAHCLDLSVATVSEEEFNELVAIMRDGPNAKPLTPEAQWRRDYHKAMFHRRLVGVQPDLFGGKPVTHMYKAAPGPVSDWKPEPVEEKLSRIARDPKRRSASADRLFRRRNWPSSSTAQPMAADRAAGPDCGRFRIL